MMKYLLLDSKTADGRPQRKQPEPSETPAQPDGRPAAKTREAEVGVQCCPSPPNFILSKTRPEAPNFRASPQEAASVPGSWTRLSPAPQYSLGLGTVRLHQGVFPPVGSYLEGRAGSAPPPPQGVLLASAGTAWVVQARALAVSLSVFH